MGDERHYRQRDRMFLRQPLIMLKKQLGHLPENKVDKAYDFSDYMPMRKEFMPEYEKELVNLGMKI